MARDGSGETFGIERLRIADLSQDGLPILFVAHSLGGLVCQNVRAHSVQVTLGRH